MDEMQQRVLSTIRKAKKDNNDPLVEFIYRLEWASKRNMLSPKQAYQIVGKAAERLGRLAIELHELTWLDLKQYELNLGLPQDSPRVPTKDHP